jgi:hypothetical protein
MPSRLFLVTSYARGKPARHGRGSCSFLRASFGFSKVTCLILMDYVSRRIAEELYEGLH